MDWKPARGQCSREAISPHPASPPIIAGLSKGQHVLADVDTY
jgi:hypothetical protein